MRTEKRCPICRVVKGRDDFYIKADGVWTTYCKPCTNAYNAAHRLKMKALHPPTPKPPKPVVPCAYELCDRVADTFYKKEGKTEGPYCAMHWNQRSRGKELAPVNDYREAYVDERLRRCTACDRIQPKSAFYARPSGALHAMCRQCALKASAFNHALRVKDFPLALDKTEHMPERMKEKSLKRLADAIKSDEFERSNAGANDD